MAMTHGSTAPSPTPVLPGAAVIARIRRLVVVAVAAGGLYSVFTTGSRAGCAGGVTGDGGFLDADGGRSDVAPTCVSLALTPSPLILIVMVGIVLWALGRVLRRADTEASAVRTIDRAALAIAIVAVVSVLIAHAWFGIIPLYGIDDSGTYIWPFPFAGVELQTSPMTAS